MESIGVEEQPRIAIPGPILVGLVVPSEEAAAVGKARVEQREERVQALRFPAREVPAAWDGHRPMLLPPLRLVAIQVARRAEVVRALVAPDHGVRQAALRALHLDEPTVIPQEFVRFDIIEVLAEAADHRVHWLFAVRRQVQVPPRVVADDHLPLGRLRVAQREEAVPVPRGLVRDAQLRGHVLDHLRRQQGLFHVVRVAATAEENPHGAQACQAERRGLDFQDVWGSCPLLREPQFVKLDIQVLTVLEARLHHQIVVDVNRVARGRASVGLVVPGVELGLRLRVQRHVRRDPLWDLAERQRLEGLLGEAPQAQGVRELDGPLLALDLPVGVDRVLGVPAVERIDGFVALRAHDAVGVREAPRVWVAHHDVDVVHSHVKQVVSPPLQLVPKGAPDVERVHFLELLPRLLVPDVQVAEEASVAADLERLVRHVLEARPEHLGPLRPVARRPAQRDLHVGGLDASCDSARRRPDAQIHLVGHLFFEGQPGLLLHEVADVHGLPEVLGREAVGHGAAYEVALGAGLRVVAGRGAARHRQLAALELGQILAVDLLELALQLHPRGVDVVAGRRRLLWGRLGQGRHLAEQLGPRHLVRCVDGRLRLERRVGGQARVHELRVLQLHLLPLLGVRLAFARDRRDRLGQRARLGWSGRRRGAGEGVVERLGHELLRLVVPGQLVVFSHSDGIVPREVTFVVLVVEGVAQRPLAAVVVDDLHDLPDRKWERPLSLVWPIDG
mmetsp:Transcript_100655/g.307605  ORF Transcript_100655/g.307605 Transcript_100655/m.307605 type:complete len:732 (+) Transcript_100655:2994-5189(+)